MSAVPKPARPATKPLASAPRKSSMNPIVLIGDSGFFTVIPGSLVSLAPRNDGLDGSTFTARDESIVSQTNFRRPSNKQGKQDRRGAAVKLARGPACRAGPLILRISASL